MGCRTSKAQVAHPQGHRQVAGHHPKPYCAAAGRRPGPCIAHEFLSRAFGAFIDGKFRHLKRLFNQLPDLRKADRCRYTPAEFAWTLLLMFLGRMGSRNQMDAQRNSGALPEAVAWFAGRAHDDIPADGQRRVSCSDNIVRFLKTLPPRCLEQIQLGIVKDLFESRLFDGSRVFGNYQRIIIDGSVREKCRKGFEEGGKANGGGRYRYVLQASLLLCGHPIPLMQEHIDVDDPVSEKEDCEINAARRLLPRLKAAFPRMSFIVLGDSLYACRPVAAVCARLGWRFCFTFKEGRTPAVWQEAMALMDAAPENALRYRDKPDADPDCRRSRLRWAQDIDFSEKEDGSLVVTAIEQRETHKGTETRYAWISDVPRINCGNVILLVDATGRKRHPIEDMFNTLKNNGIGMEHVFCANATASKNLYSLMQIAFMLWTLFHHGLLRRICAWAGTWSQVAIAKSLLEGLRLFGGADPGFKVGQLRFVT